MARKSKTTTITTSTPVAILPEVTTPEATIEMGTYTLPKGTKETNLYLITPELGNKPRWFEKKRLTFTKSDDGLFSITLPKKEWGYRKID